MEKSEISVVIIAKNEAANLPRLLKSVKWADEILVADTGSSDATAEIAAELGARVIDLPWEGFGKTKQKAVNSARNNWILSLDADEEVSSALRERILELKDKLTEDKAYKIKRVSWYLGKRINWCGWQNDQPLRFFNRQTAEFNEKIVHEGVRAKVPIRLLKEPIYHYTYPALADHFSKMNFYSSLNVEEKYRRGCRYTIIGAIFQGLWKFMQMYILRQGFRDGKTGFLLCYHSAIGQYLKYIKLWEESDTAH